MGTSNSRQAVISPLRLTALLVLGTLLSGCYVPTNGVREPLPGPTATPPWPYEPGVAPPGRNAYPNPGTPLDRQAPYFNQGYGSQGYGSQAPTPGYGGWQGGAPNASPPPPSQSIPERYPDWRFDGPEGRGFAFYLAAGYRQLAKEEDNQHDFEDAAKFLARATSVEGGIQVEPERLTMRTLPAYAVDDLLYARQRLMQAFGRGATTRLPKLAAEAQVAFDCWMEQQEENIQPHDVARCRNNFEATIVRLENALIEKARPAEPANCAPSPCPAPCPAPAPVCSENLQLVYFDFNKHELNDAGRSVVQRVVEEARRFSGSTIVVSGHADRSGGDSYNDALSKRRLDTVIQALEQAGVAPTAIARAEYYGEHRPRVSTADGVRNPENRRVEIRIACARAPAPSEANCPPSPPAAPR